MFYNTKETIINFLVVVGVVAFIGAGVLSLLYLKEKQCLKSYENFTPEWSLLSGCRITINGILTPVDIVRELK